MKKDIQKNNETKANLENYSIPETSNFPKDDEGYSNFPDDDEEYSRLNNGPYKPTKISEKNQNPVDKYCNERTKKAAEAVIRIL